MIHACLQVKKKKAEEPAGGGLGIIFHRLVSFWSICWASLHVIFLTKDWVLKDTSTFRAGTSNCKLKQREVLCFSAAGTNWINLSSFKVGDVVFCHVPVLISNKKKTHERVIHFLLDRFLVTLSFSVSLLAVSCDNYSYHNPPFEGLWNCTKHAIFVEFSFINYEPSTSSGTD